MTYDQALHMAMVWGAQLVVDIVVFVLTLWKSSQLRTRGYSNLVDIFMRDGAMYFAVISAVNAGNIAVLIVASNPMRGLTGGIANVLSAVMISRLVLNLRACSMEVPGLLSVHLSTRGDGSLAPQVGQC
ncbi:hypothetical protein SCLCIDRAFT_745328 [Scleroderma citrinum Foug A]|uniref:Uncharacterized protein n=1 Tax=Scleroderma citrinum Foug A TaxID=1036808 RepID=A0A0C2ZPL0_9AGAM|nr:hypothetical protein SCLCIDRAFT_745328 [Scleroderma citrinum Foug A]